MKKLFIGLLLSTVALTSFASDNANESDRTYLFKDKGMWIFEDGFVIDPPFVSFWMGMDGKLKNPKSQSSKILIKFDCRRQKYRFEAGIEYSLPQNKGETISENFDASRWWPIEPGTIFNAMGKAACRNAK